MIKQIKTIIDDITYYLKEDNTRNVHLEIMIGTKETLENDDCLHVKPSGKKIYVIYSNFSAAEIENIHYSIYDKIKDLK